MSRPAPLECTTSTASLRSLETTVGVRVTGRRVCNRTFLHVLEATIHGSRSGRETVLPPPPRCQTSSRQHISTGVVRDTHPSIVLPDSARTRLQRRISPTMEDGEAALGRCQYLWAPVPNVMSRYA